MDWLYLSIALEGPDLPGLGLGAAGLGVMQ